MSTRTSRRSFLARSAAAAGAGFAIPAYVPRQVFGANEKLQIGHIGLGGRGLSIMRPHVDSTVAVCDCDENHLTRAYDRTKQRAKKYKRYEDLLEQKDIDAVYIASPDHWHALMTIHACQAGKDVYCEKPACCTIPEGKAMVAAAQKHKRIVQIGSQGRSQKGGHAANTFIRNGMCGTISKVTCWHPMNPVGGDPNKNGDPPPYLDWDRWVGPAKMRPYNPNIHPGKFRWVLDIGGGNIRDRGAHIMSVICWIMQADESWPVTVEGIGEKPPAQNVWDVPKRMEITYTFKDPDWTLLWAQPGKRYGGKRGYGAKYWGDKDAIIVDGGDGFTKTEEKAMNYAVPADGVKVPHAVDFNHEKDFLSCVRTRKKNIMPVEAGVKVAALNNMGNAVYIAAREQGEPVKLTWDPKTEKFTGTNCEAANAFLHRPARAPYTLPDTI